jgi:hypothetical protein
MRARNYSVLNRSIARGITYALRDSNRKKYKTNINYNNTVKMPPISDTEGDWIVVTGFVMLLFIVGFISRCL